MGKRSSFTGPSKFFKRGFFYTEVFVDIGEGLDGGAIHSQE